MEKRIEHIIRKVRFYIQSILQEEKTDLHLKDVDAFNSFDIERYGAWRKRKIKAFNKNKAWERFETQIKEKKTGRKLSVELMRYVAVLILPVALSGYLIYNAISTEEVCQVTWVNHITPRTQKASLVLDNGEVIDLEKQENTTIKTHNGHALINKGNKLSYEREMLTKVEAKWHRLIVPKGGEYQLELADGTQVWLNSDSELRYTDKFIGKERIVYLKGEAYFDVAEDKDHIFIVKTHALDVQVLGTEFNVKSYLDEEQVLATLVEGKIRAKIENEELELLPEDQLILNRNTGAIKKQKVNTELYTAWKDGVFVFKDQPLGNILQAFSRWYDVEVFYVNTQVKEELFSMYMDRYEDIRLVLEKMEKTGNVKFELNKKVLIVK